MEESNIRFPITCPRCGDESLTEFRAVVVTIAVLEWRSMRLYSHAITCFGIDTQITEFVGRFNPRRYTARAVTFLTI
jgi:hypothetical protein